VMSTSDTGRSNIVRVASVLMKVWTPNGEWSAETNYGSLDHTMTVLKEHLENCPDWNNVRITMSRVSTVKAAARQEAGDE
jgi:hypothetical protein